MSRFFFRAKKMILLRIDFKLSTLYTKLKFSLHDVKYGMGLRSRGIPRLDLSLKASLIISDHLTLNNSHYYNTIGRQQKCTFSVSNGAVLKIGNHVGISCTTIVCRESIEIQDHVHIGGNCEIYDSDFHDIDFRKRIQIPEDYSAVQTKPIVIQKNVFIGAHSTILKGVTIGEGAIIGACSLVVKNVPPYEIWGGNPIKYISAAIR